MGDVREKLQAYLGGRLAPGVFRVTWSDLHGLHGGLTLTVHGTGEVEQRAVRTAVHPPKLVRSAELRRLVNLLLELNAWEQRVPERAPVPDESTGTLEIHAGDVSSTVWEWHNDLARNQRLARIRDLMCEVAWDASKPKSQGWPPPP